MPGTIHLVLSLSAIVIGGVILLRYKGTRVHRWLGYAYAACMLGVVATSFLLFKLTGRMTVLHWAAIVSALTLGAGLFSVRYRKPRNSWLEGHAAWMAWSYVGLLGAFVAESLTRYAMPLLRTTLEKEQLFGAFWALVGVATALTMITGSLLIRMRLPKSIASVTEGASA